MMFEPSSSPKPPSLSLDKYLGSYSHPSYGTIVLHRLDGAADSVVAQGSFPGRVPLDPLVLEHVDGDVFLAKADLAALIPVRVKATFEVSDDVPKRLGMEFETGLVIWFDVHDKSTT